jgi:hypothetical protein
VAYENRLELARILLADFAPDVVNVKAPSRIARTGLEAGTL